jgi:hypothetical protein
VNGDTIGVLPVLREDLYEVHGGAVLTTVGDESEVELSEMWDKNIRPRESPVLLLVPPPSSEIVLSNMDNSAYARFHEAQGADDEMAAFHALFEALDWSHAIDDVIAHTWSPRGEVLGYAWRRDPVLSGANQLENLMSGLRYVRDRVHHRWADALVSRDVRGGLTFPMSFPASLGTVVRWVWRDLNELPTAPNVPREAPGREAYGTALAGHRVSEALQAMSEAFAFVGSLLDPPTPKREAPIVHMQE